MKWLTVCLLIFFIVYSNNSFGDQLDALGKIDRLPNKMEQLLAKFPSMGMAFVGLSDSRIKIIAQEEIEAFKLVTNAEGSEKQQSVTILVNPKKWTGFLWWTKPKMVQIQNSEIELVRNGIKEFNLIILKFLSEI